MFVRNRNNELHPIFSEDTSPIVVLQHLTENIFLKMNGILGDFLKIIYSGLKICGSSPVEAQVVIKITKKEIGRIRIFVLGVHCLIKSAWEVRDIGKNYFLLNKNFDGFRIHFFSSIFPQNHPNQFQFC